MLPMLGANGIRGDIAIEMLTVAYTSLYKSMETTVPIIKQREFNLFNKECVANKQMCNVCKCMCKYV